jgi:hypothetical protein
MMLSRIFSRQQNMSTLGMWGERRGLRVEGKRTPVTVKVGYEQAKTLAALLEPFLAD